ncbi:MAG: hypothetical protein NTW04_02855 [Elusimicrobia bacterium]|nr:hypothetical protein [Elusimicrobiota bacterium]
MDPMVLAIETIYDGRGMEALVKDISEADKLSREFDKNLAGLDGAQDAAKTSSAAFSDMQADSRRATNNMSGGFDLFKNNLKSGGADWSKSWEKTVGGAAGYFLSSFGKSMKDMGVIFQNFENFSDGVFESLTRSFSNMLSDMAGQAAKSSIFGSGNLFGGLLGGVASGVGNLLGFAEGGLVPGNAGDPLMAVVHGGEYVLPSEVVSAIKSGNAPSLPPKSAVSNSSQVTINHSPVININGQISSDIDVRRVAQELAEATRRGVSWAVEQAKVSYKVGLSRSGDAAL